MVADVWGWRGRVGIFECLVFFVVDEDMKNYNMFTGSTEHQSLISMWWSEQSESHRRLLVKMEGGVTILER